MWVVVMLFIASLAAAGVYWVSLATLPEDDVLEERADRWREWLEYLGLDRLQPWLDGLTSGLGELASRMDLGTRLEDLRSRARDLARRESSRGERPGPMIDAPAAANERLAGGASPVVPAAAVAVETAPLTSASALEAPAAGRERRSRLPNWSWPAPPGEDAADTTPDDPTTDDVADADGVLYVPVVRDLPDAHSRLFGLLGIVVLVMVAGGVLALGVWQSIHLIARILDNFAGA
jgi:hypothetical protein